MSSRSVGIPPRDVYFTPIATLLLDPRLLLYRNQVQGLSIVHDKDSSRDHSARSMSISTGVYAGAGSFSRDRAYSGFQHAFPVLRSITDSRLSVSAGRELP